MTGEPGLPRPVEGLQEQAPAGSPPQPSAASPETPRPKRRWRKLVRIVAALLSVYLLLAYVLVPALWTRYARRHPSLEDIPGITYTGSRIPGDPPNVALIGTKPQVIKIMLAAGWHPADPLTLRSCVEIAADTVLRRSYDDAPVSNLYLFGRKEDLAFEQPVGPDPKKRNHVRFWHTDRTDPDERPLWIGSATFDRRVGFSHTTGQVTHHIEANVDAERDHLFEDLEKTRDLAEKYIEYGFHKTREGHNGGGDPWHTDGNLYVGVIAPTLK